MSTDPGKKIEIKLIPRVPNGDDGLGWGTFMDLQHVQIVHEGKVVKSLGPMPLGHAQDMKKTLEMTIELARQT